MNRECIELDVAYLVQLSAPVEVKPFQWPDERAAFQSRQPIDDRLNRNPQSTRLRARLHLSSEALHFAERQRMKKPPKCA
jgi:hypothetical protein